MTLVDDSLARGLLPGLKSELKIAWSWLYPSCPLSVHPLRYTAWTTSSGFWKPGIFELNFCTSCLQLSLRNLIIDRLASFVVTSHMACDSLLLLCGEQSDAFEVQPRQGALAGAA